MDRSRESLPINYVAASTYTSIHFLAIYKQDCDAIEGNNEHNLQRPPSTLGPTQSASHSSSHTYNTFTPPPTSPQVSKDSPSDRS